MEASSAAGKRNDATEAIQACAAFVADWPDVGRHIRKLMAKARRTILDTTPGLFRRLRGR